VHPAFFEPELQVIAAGKDGTSGPRHSQNNMLTIPDIQGWMTEAELLWLYETA
jgi:hypothetical protein